MSLRAYHGLNYDNSGEIHCTTQAGKADRRLGYGWLHFFTPNKQRDAYIPERLPRFSFEIHGGINPEAVSMDLEQVFELYTAMKGMIDTEEFQDALMAYRLKKAVKNE